MSEQQLRAELDAVYRSTSWRITAPFRLLVSLIKQPRTILGLPRRVVRWSIRFVMRQALLNRLAKGVLSFFPNWLERFQQKAQQIRMHEARLAYQAIQLPEVVNSENMEHLSPAARDIFSKLKINHQK